MECHGGVCIGGSNAEWTPEQDRRAAVVDEDDGPEPEPELTFFIIKFVTLIICPWVTV
jgi:hypothetical protein